jgi:glucose dehydrogenase
MIFKGSLGTGGTITSLPTASSANEGFTYKVITAGTYASQTAKVGDTIICAKTGTNTYA